MTIIDRLLCSPLNIEKCSNLFDVSNTREVNFFETLFLNQNVVAVKHNMHITRRICVILFRIFDVIFSGICETDSKPTFYFQTAYTRCTPQSHI